LASLILSLYCGGYVGHENIEIIFSDNASTDGTGEFLSALPSDFLVLYNKKNLGYSRNAFGLLRHARGKYFWLVGDDDVINVSATFLLPLIENNGSSNIMFVEDEELKIACSSSLLPYSSLKLPFGFIGSCIQPNTSEFVNLFEQYSYNDKHDSPHFFARWLFFLKYKKASLYSLGDISLVIAQTTQQTSKLASFISLLSRIHRHDYSFNWYYSYLHASSDPILVTPCKFVKLSFNNQIHHDLNNSLARTTFYWFLRLPILFFRDFGYAYFISKILAFEYSFLFSRYCIQRLTFFS
jgi:glycosyltransferase involved in cell wall biosynthesis